MKKKIPSAVEMAQAFKAAKEAELAAARDAVKTLEKEEISAYVAVRKAQKEEDASLPKCVMASVARGGAESSHTEVVILRKTASGMLAVRGFGEPSGATLRFKFNQHIGRYQQAEKSSPFAYSHRELRGVPSEYMPTGAKP